MSLPVFPSPQYVSRIWRTQDGLPENRIRAISQTPDGYLWVGTSSGLARFDGVRFVVYTRFNTPSMTDDNIRALTVVRDGSLWIGTDGGGLLHYKNSEFQAFGPKQGLTNEFVSSILEDRRGTVWVTTSRGLFRRDGLRFVRVDESLHLPNIAFFRLVEGRDGRLFTCGPSGLFVVEDGKLSRHDAKVEGDSVYRLAEARDGSLWLGTNHGLRIIGSKQYLNRPFLTSVIGAILEDHAGNIWLGTEGDGLFRVRGSEDSNFRAPAALPDNNVLAIHEDRERNIWVGTSDGLVRLSKPDVGVLSSREGLSDDNVSTVLCDPSGSIWLATIRGGVFRYTNGLVKGVRLPPPANLLRIRGSFQDHTGAMWYGTDNQGAVRVEKGRVTRFSKAEGLRNNGIQVFFEDRKRQIWIGTTSGLSRWDGSRLTNYYLEDGLSYGWIRAIAEDNNGDLLVGTDRGMNRIHDGKFVQDPAFESLTRDRIWSIYAAAPDTLWIATRGAGLVRVRNGKASRLTTGEGLLSNSIFQVVGDSGGKLWMSGPRGLSSASMTDLNAVADGTLQSVAVLSYGIGDGMESTQINGGVQSAGCIAGDGELWFPSVKGAVHFKPKPAPVNHHSPVRLESILLDGQAVPATGETIIGPDRHRVEIEFTSCSLRAPDRVTFQYKLDGVDARWIASAGRRAAYYGNLPAGRYQFRVIARDGAPGGGSSEAGMVLVVRPHFYQTAWFYALGFVFTGICIAGAFRFQERQSRDRYNLRLAERTRIAREMHDTVVQGCVGVSTLIEAAVGSARTDQDQMLECLDNARIHLRLTLDEARQALTDLRHDSFENGLSDALSELTDAVSSEKGIPVTMEVNGSTAKLADSTNRTLLLVTREAIRNAVMHGSPSAVAVRLLFGLTAICLDIRDDGCGFEPAPGHLATAGHFGILGMRERMEQIGGSLEVLSSPGNGTTIKAYLPL